MAVAFAKLLIEKGIINQDQFMRKLSEERATYPKLVKPHTAMTIGEILIWEATNVYSGSADSLPILDDENVGR
jgi:hypothetical protein